MRVLIVEDSAFNAYCLRRLLESVTQSMASSVQVTIANNSQAALLAIHNRCPDMVIIDGDLGALKRNTYFNGPELADILLHKYVDLPVIAWTDSDSMLQQFASVFSQHQLQLNEYNCWAKNITMSHIYKTWSHYFSDFLGTQFNLYLPERPAYYR